MEGLLLKRLESADLNDLRNEWERRYGAAPRLRSPDLLRRILAWRIQAAAEGGFDRITRRLLVGASAGPETLMAEGTVLERNRRGRHQRTIASAPLTGILYDALGNRMAATHARGHGGKRYLYYVSPVSASDPDAARVLRRVAAPAIEEILIERLRCWTRRHTTTWLEVRPFIRRVELHPEAVVVDLAPPPHENWTAAQSETLTTPADGIVRITSPVTIYTRGGRTSRIEGAARSGRLRPDKALIAGLRRGAYRTRGTRDRSYGYPRLHRSCAGA